jgi:hypothetical protein
VATPDETAAKMTWSQSFVKVNKRKTKKTCEPVCAKTKKKCKKTKDCCKVVSAVVACTKKKCTACGKAGFRLAKKCNKAGTSPECCNNGPCKGKKCI